MNHRYLCASPNGDNPRLLVAKDPEEAARQAVQSRSVSEILKGTVIAVWLLGNFPEQFECGYDGEPINEDHSATGANLTLRPLGRPRV